jgi:hypothetical protein
MWALAQRNRKEEKGKSHSEKGKRKKENLSGQNK